MAASPSSFSSVTTIIPTLWGQEIVSPESSLLDLPGIDGYIAQVWTGTSRTENTYEGETKERTFETAYLEYGVMQELVRGTNRRMWFLADPIEDNPRHDWNDYRILCQGPKTQLWVNGQLTVDYREADAAIEQKGLIALQIHGGLKGTIRYRAIRIRAIPGMEPPER